MRGMSKKSDHKKSCKIRVGELRAEKQHFIEVTTL